MRLKMLSSTRSLWESNGQHVARLELQQPRSWSGGQKRSGRRRAETHPFGFLQQVHTLFLRETRATQNIKYLDDQTMTGSYKLAQRDNVSLQLICAWMPTPWHLVNNNPFLLQTRILFLVSLGTCWTSTVCLSSVCVCVCMRLSYLSLCYTRIKDFTVCWLSTFLSIKKGG